jgi:hypothetical protein
MGSVRAHFTYQNDYMSIKLWNIMEIKMNEQTPWNREGALDFALDKLQTIYRLHVQNTLGYVVFPEQKQRSSVLTPLLWICCSVSAGVDFQMNRVYPGSLCSEEQSKAKKTLIGGRGRQACVQFVWQHFVWHTGKVSSISPVFLWPFGRIVMASRHAWNAVGWICR